MVSFPSVDRALFNWPCSAQRYRIAALVTLDTASQMARMLSSLGLEHNEPIFFFYIFMLCTEKTLNAKVDKKNYLTLLSIWFA